MTPTIPVFINAERVDVPAGIAVVDALRMWSEDMAADVEDGSQQVLDSRGLPVALDTTVYAGAIFRLIGARGSRDEAGDEPDDALH